MSTGDDDDLRLQRASASLLSDFGQLLPRLLRKRSHNGKLGQMRLQVRDVDLYKACALIEPFQEDPQILDAHLKVIIPPLVASYIEVIQVAPKENLKKNFLPLSHVICCLLNLFCKVRGERVIKGFFNNEPRYLELILSELEAGVTLRTKNTDEVEHPSLFPWVERYVLLLWLSHLLLAPFPLESMSGLQPTAHTSIKTGITLPLEAPGVTLRILTICIYSLHSASKERSAAAQLLVRLSVRPDMQKLGLLDALVEWSLLFFSKVSEDQADIHQCLGVLSFLSGLVASTTKEEISPFLAAIYGSCRRILDHDSLAFVRSSAVARKLIVKSLRNIVVHCLQISPPPAGLDSTTLIEEVIEFLLDSLADADTPVRYGSSKALSIITLKLNSGMATEVVEAILGSLNENVHWQGSKRNLNSVNPLRWHGLTLTLSQLLYRKAIDINHLPEVLNALLLSLGFEQRSPTGGSVGTNVRDAACFGLWALSRRYATANLLAVETTSIRASEHHEALLVPQVLAIELVVAACLDPAGNIRRGSSAALQELIGRHPNTIEEGISLVQVIDFHAVGLRPRAMCEVAIKAGELRSLYWDALFENLLEWRGTGALDSDSRLFAAKAIGLLTKGRPSSILWQMQNRICKQLVVLRSREVEERQGLVSALAALAESIGLATDFAGPRDLQFALFHLWNLLGDELKLESKAITSVALRPEFTAASICNFIGAMAALTNRLPKDCWPSDIPSVEIRRVLDLCLSRHEQSVLEAIEKATPAVLKLLSRDGVVDIENIVFNWLSRLENEASYNGLRCSGHAIALGSAYAVLDNHKYRREGLDLPRRIVKVLTFRSTSAVAVEARTVALRALGILLRSTSVDPASNLTRLAFDVEAQIGMALHVALNDYTTTERGDIGALVRLEALNAVSSAWAYSVPRDKHGEVDQKIYADVVRLSLERLDKIRVKAAQLLQKATLQDCEDGSITMVQDVSSSAYFASALHMLQPTTDTFIEVKESVCIGFVNSAGMGSESVTQNSRAALLNFVDSLPEASTPGIQCFALLDLVNCMTDLIKRSLHDDRTLLPMLEVVAFLFDMQVMQRLQSTSFNFRTLLSYIQKAHYKSTHMQKLHLALDVYRGLGVIPATRADTVAKVMSMLLHPFPKIRIAAAETLWFLTREQSLKLQDWSLPSKSLKPAMEEIKASLTIPLAG
ncbi:tubulin folding cofactor D C terminal-domain-containing protein [Pyrenochaeta sp. MPI-SDFR-AT-0127]|nr:tubulin folding cofactor D C terminal-domain-containing protein [Pyrenochaeta sp. MPI-SDFR-AT-0127]